MRRTRKPILLALVALFFAAIAWPAGATMCICTFTDGSRECLPHTNDAECRAIDDKISNATCVYVAPRTCQGTSEKLDAVLKQIKAGTPKVAK